MISYITVTAYDDDFFGELQCKRCEYDILRTVPYTHLLSFHLRKNHFIKWDEWVLRMYLFFIIEPIKFSRQLQYLSISLSYGLFG
jgi:hypothetical protein